MTETTEKEIKTFDPFTTPARDGEVNMVLAVQDHLMLGGVPAQCQLFYQNHPDINMVRGLCFEAQRFVLNQFWMLQLQKVQNEKKISTIDHRFCLLEEGTPEQWLKNFHEMIVTFAAEHALPS